MSSRLRIAFATLALMFSANPITERAQQKLVTADQAQIVDTVRTIFTAAEQTMLRGSTPSLLQTFTHMMEAPDSTEAPL
jgi:hypothetical protein